MLWQSPLTGLAAQRRPWEDAVGIRRNWSAWDCGIPAMGPHALECVHPEALSRCGRLPEFLHLGFSLQSWADVHLLRDEFQWQHHKGERVHIERQGLVECVILTETGPPVVLGPLVDR